MKYKINEIFYSIQGEGFNTGYPAIFIRFSGCNLKCPWCDTFHEEYELYTKEDIENAVEKLKFGKDVMIIFTGGEPTLQLSDEEILPGYFRALETNGIIEPPKWLDWITCSPKTDLQFNTWIPDEIKVVYEPKREKYLEEILSLDTRLFLQPLEKDGHMNIKETVSYILKHPKYRLSLQTHKLIGVK